MSMKAITAAVCAVIVLFQAAELDASRFRQAAAGVPEDEAVAQFHLALGGYLALRRNLLTETSGPAPNSSSVQLTDASDALAGAIQRARRSAAVGDLFSPAVAAVVKRRVDSVVRRENLGPVLATMDDEEPRVREPKLHLRFPGAAQMATMPGALLATLPILPRELEYRIVGRYLVLRDVEAALIIDYVADIIPR
jgi:hypothetical protein